MVKSKSARLSLTLPGPPPAQADQVRPEQAKAAERPTMPANTGAADRNTASKPDSTRFNAERERYRSRSSSPATASPPANERPKSPASPSSPGLTSLPPFPTSPTVSSKHARDQSKSFFSNFMASKSSTKIQPVEPTIRKVQQDVGQGDDTVKKPMRTKSTPDLRGESVSEPVPDLPDLDANSAHNINAGHVTGHKIPRRPVGPQIPTLNVNQPTTLGGGSAGPASPTPETQESRRNPRLFHNFMRRNHSNRSDDAISSKPGTPIASKAPDASAPKPPSRDHSTGRNAPSHADSEDIGDSRVQLKDQRSLSFRENAGSTLMHGLKNTAKAAGGIGKAGTKFFKQAKQANNYTDTQLESAQFYQPRVITKPLREQTRVTRIAKRLEDSKDKTEFWMPALPWRCIDYLNFNGCEIEGLYRVPGSNREVMLWKQRFDQEYDVNLFDQNDLYDVNTIGSLFKAWLRELPEEVFPLKAQDELSEKYGSQDKAPDELRDVLSELPPWNYYLLFAITCHLSLLNAHQEKNKMTFHNLYVCFAPALRMNNDCFRWLVADWRNCWKGCITETEALREEYRILDGDPLDLEQSDLSDENTGTMQSKDGAEEAPSRIQPSSAATQITMSPTRTKHRSGKEPQPIRVSPGRSKDDSELPTTYEEKHFDVGSLAPNTPSHNRSASQLPELSFPQPISPIFPAHS